MISDTSAVTSSPAETAATVFMSLLTVIAIAGNLAVLAAIVRNPSLRVQLSNFFVINLCAVDLIASVVVMPLSLAVHSRSTLPSINVTLTVALTDADDPVTCTALRLLTAFVVFTSVLSVALANVERYLSIRHPMHHAAHLTVGRTLAMIVGVWTVALGVAVIPVIADWDVLDIGTRCCRMNTSSTSTSATVYAIVVVAAMFVAPTLMMIVMCCSIYSVARQAHRQVASGVDERNHSTNQSVGCLAVQSSTNCTTPNNVVGQHNFTESSTAVRQHNISGNANLYGQPATSLVPATGAAAECVIRVMGREDDGPTAARHHGGGQTVSYPSPTRVVDSQLASAAVADRRWKAATTLLFIILTFVPLWWPYFAYSLLRAADHHREQFPECGSAASTYNAEIVVVWIGFATFASNAFVYGWMNQVIRGALRDVTDSIFSSCPLAARGRARLSQVLGAGDAEDFFQFLERTSSVDRAQSLAQSSAA